MRKATNEQIINSYARLNNVWRVAEELGMCGQSVQERLVKLGIGRNNPAFTKAEIEVLKEKYTRYLLEGKLQQLADEMGRTKQFICRKARALGLTDIKRSPALLANYKSPKGIKKWEGKVHPRGMLGKKHTDDLKERMSGISTRNQAKINADPEKRADIIKRTLMTRFIKGSLVVERKGATWKAGWRDIGKIRKYYRSRWEANYARYLEFLKVHGNIKDWDHECEVFWFDGIKRGCMSYLPDFKVTENNGSISFHEVKGWMDERSKTKINRMRIYHPNVNLLLIQAKWFKDNGRKLKGLIPDWE